MSLSRIRIRIGKGPDRIDVSVKQAGQIVVIFALMLTVLIGLVGIAIDVTYAWRNGLQVQRAADAAAMAGVVYLPGDPTTGELRAGKIAASNGYSTGVAAAPTVGDPRKMDVTITATVPTFFVRLFGINNWTISRTARAAYNLPVPMGSPLNYMGLGCFVTASTTAPCATAGVGASGVTTTGTSGGTPLGSLGAWGAIYSMSGDQTRGDAYATKNNGPATWPVNVATNVQYDPNGYFYTVSLPAGGAIKIFDPGFCEMGGATAPATGFYGAGDHWEPDTPNYSTPASIGGVSTYYTLWTTNGQPMNPSAWTVTGTPSGSTFANLKTTDGGGHGVGACNASWHNTWWTFASGLAAGTYEIQISTTNGGDAGVHATNMFALMAVGGNDASGNSPAVYGYDKMAIYNDLAASAVPQNFYIAKVDKDTGAGKTLTLDLFDIGDAHGDGIIQIISPDGGGFKQKVSSFSYTTYNYNAAGAKVANGNCDSSESDACSDTSGSRTSIKVAKCTPSSPSCTGKAFSFDNTWIEITVPLGASYGSGGKLWQGGWWQVRYTVAAGNDMTTWSVNVNGNPVRLVPL